MVEREVAGVVLAAGKGKRMKSSLSKMLHEIAGKKIVEYSVDTLRNIGVSNIIVVIGYQGDKIRELFGENVRIVDQGEPKGTGHALLSVEPLLKDFSGDILVIHGDMPLIREETLKQLLSFHREKDNDFTLVTTYVKDYKLHYGRIIRDSRGEIVKIVEEKDATEDEKKIYEMNPAVYCFRAKGLFDALKRIKADNAQGEFYLTDILEIYLDLGKKVGSILIKEDYSEFIGINDRINLAEAMNIIYKRNAERLMLEGVTIVDPKTTFIDEDVEIGIDTVIYPFSVIRGRTKIGKECIIGPGTHIIDSQIGDNVEILESYIEKSLIKNNVKIGPYAHLRPENIVEEGVKIGNFVEVKKSRIGKGTKASHLTYIGDSDVGENVNIGAGTITCNYDGVKKNKTIIEDNVFIGSNNTLVAPVTIRKGAYTGAGSTITKEVPPYALALGRARQINKTDWVIKKRRGKDE